MATATAVINVHKGKLTLKVLDEVVEYKVFESLAYPIRAHDCYSVDIMDDIEEEANMRVCYQEVMDEVITKDGRQIRGWLGKFKGGFGRKTHE